MDQVVHFEIPADDADRAVKFYADVFGWHIVPMPEMSYNIAHTGPTDDKTGMHTDQGMPFINGGIMKRGTPVAVPTITLNVESIDESIKKIESHGGKILKAKQAVGDMGFIAYFADSEGNVTGIWELAKKA